MKFTVTLDRDEDGVWVVECPAIPGCVSQGQTKEEAIENIKDAIKLCPGSPRRARDAAHDRSRSKSRSRVMPCSRW